MAWFRLFRRRIRIRRRGGGGIGGAAATSRRSYYCNGCNRTVTILAMHDQACPFCYGASLQELDGNTSSPSPPHAAASASASEAADDDIEFSFPTPPPSPPPLPPFTTVDGANLFNSHHNITEFFHHLSPLPQSILSNSGTAGTTSSSETLGNFSGDSPPSPRSPLPPLPRFPAFTTVDDANTTESSDHPFPTLLPPPPPPLSSSLNSTCTISRFPFAYPQPLDHFFTTFTPTPPIPSAPALITRNSIYASTSGRTTRFLPAQVPEPQPLPLPPPLHELTPIARDTPSSSMGIQQRPWASPPRSSNNWGYFLPCFNRRDFDMRDFGLDVDMLPDDDLLYFDPNPFGFDGEVEVVEDKLWEDKFVLDRKMSREMMCSEESLQCAVCLDNLELNETVKRMPCKHIFHSACIKTWLDSRPTCPVCRYELPINYNTHC